jgi:hypothetical protein
MSAHFVNDLANNAFVVPFMNQIMGGRTIATE